VGLIGGPLAFAGGILVLFGVLQMQSPGLLAMTLPEIAWELSITVYPLIWGFKSLQIPGTDSAADPLSIP
jgi:hypothetical protein